MSRSLRIYTLLTLSVLALLTRTASAQDALPRPEHPRPDFERSDWLNLNGSWQFEIDAQGDGEARGLTTGKSLSGKILVPFCPESSLSGIGQTDFMTHVWYRRSFEVPASMRGKRLLLHFEAVDWLTRAWVNGSFLGEHRGGYSPFAFEITDVVKEGANEIVLHVFDDTRSGLQATGKQAHSLKSEGCVYTRTTGIWQTVWLEAVGSSYLRSFSLVPDVDNGRVLFQGWVDGPSQGTTVRLKAFAEGKVVAEETVRANWRSTLGVLSLSQKTAWVPGKPFLYDLSMEIEKDGKIIDSVKTYFGLRKITLEGNRFLINDQPIFQRLVLDQGFYPDGICTAPTDEALRRDVELSMAAGFNGARLHQKVFEPRLLYWADKLGYLVWGEYPSWGLNLSDQKAVGYALEEWRSIVERDRNHPSVIGWCPLNETGVSEEIASVQHLLADTQLMDPTRPLLDSSGYVHLFPGTDVYDSHDYDQNPESFKARHAAFERDGWDPFNNNLSDPRSQYRGQPYFVSEYGGIHLKTERSEGTGWGYGSATLEEYLTRYKGLTDVLLDNPNMCGFCYTQLTDIEQEQNGIYFYDRQEKCDPDLIRKINERKAAYETQPPRVRRIIWTSLLSTAKTEPGSWRYTTEPPDQGWAQKEFDDKGWNQGQAGFGTEGTPGAIVGTVWNTQDIWIRRHFTVEKLDSPILGLDLHHDEDVEIFVNGQEVATFMGYTSGYAVWELTEELKKALVQGDNVLAVHCHQTNGGQYIDVGLVTGKEKKER